MAEPAGWQVEDTDTAIVGPGAVGMTVYTGYQDFAVGYFALGVQGEEPPDLIMPRSCQVTQNTVQAIHGGNSVAQVTQNTVQVIRYHEVAPVEIPLQEVTLSGEAESLTVKITLDTQTTMKIPCTM